MRKNSWLLGDSRVRSLLGCLALGLSLPIVPPAFAQQVPRVLSPVQPLFAVSSSASTEYRKITVSPQIAATHGAYCNDGSLPVYFYRAPRSPSKNWQLHLKGGESCTHLLDCILRWNQHPERMTSSGLGATRSLSGIFLKDSRNKFSEFHQVYSWYCSSDGWMGDGIRAEDVSNGLNGLDDQFSILRAAYATSVAGDPVKLAALDNGYLNYKQKFCAANGRCTVHFKGSRIVDAILEDLRARFPIQEAQGLLVTGSSAGSNGVRQNLDRIRAKLPSKIRVLGVSDSGYAENARQQLVIRDQAGLLDPLDVQCAPAAPAMARPVFPNGPFYSNGPEYWIATRPDDSCRVTYQDAEQCRSDSKVVAEISTPLFIYQAYQDLVYLGKYDNNVKCNLPRGVKGEVSRASYNELFSLNRAVFSTNTTTHTSLESSSFFNMVRPTPQGPFTRANHYLMLERWVNSGGTLLDKAQECPTGCPSCAGRSCP